MIAWCPECKTTPVGVYGTESYECADCFKTDPEPNILLSEN